MHEIKNRASLYSQRQKQKKDISEFCWQSFHTDYIVNFCRYWKKNILIVAMLSFLAILIEVFVILLGRVIIRQLSVRLEIVLIWQMLGVLFFALIIYLIISYFSIKVEKTVLVELLNDLRRKWFSKALNKKIFSLQDNTKHSIIAKLFYHFSLVAMGFNQSLVGAWRMLLLFILVLTLSVVISMKMFMVAVFVVIISIILFFIGYMVSTNYVSREQTLYTHILRHIIKTFDNLPLYKLHQQEKGSLFKLNDLVKLDSWFRVRRDLWMKYGSDILFALLVLTGAVIYLLQLYWPELFEQDISSLFFYGIVTTYMLRLLYLSLRSGLFFVPLKLGLQLSIPEPHAEYEWHTTKINRFCLSAKKVKMTDENFYFKNQQFCTMLGENYLFVNDSRKILKQMSDLFVGIARGQAKQWILHVNGKRYLYDDWFKYNQLNYLISPSLNFTGTVGEFLFGFDRENITPEMIEKLYSQFAHHEVFDFIFSNSRVFTVHMDDQRFSITERALLQVIYAIHNNVSMVVVDSYLIDLHDPIIKGGLKILRDMSQDAIIVIMSTKENNLFLYEKIFKLTK